MIQPQKPNRATPWPWYTPPCGHACTLIGVQGSDVGVQEAVVRPEEATRLRGMPEEAHVQAGVVSCVCIGATNTALQCWRRCWQHCRMCGPAPSSHGTRLLQGILIDKELSGAPLRSHLT